jgi:uncharacterized C2H2 Zn-finger protein
MSQRIVIECDECAELGESRDAVTVELNALGQSVEVDLCDVHTKPLADLVERYVELGRKPGAGSVVVTTCPRCGRKFGSPQALGRHARDEHGESVNQMRGKSPSKTGRRAPGERVTVPESDRVPCPECGKGFAPVGLGVHRRRVHGVAGASRQAAARRRAGQDGAREDA